MSAPGTNLDGTGAPLLLIAHGSRDPRHQSSMTRLADELRARHPARPVGVGYLDHCGPTVTDALRTLSPIATDTVVAVPLFLSAAYHVKHDVPAALRAAREALPRRWRNQLLLRATRALGPDPLLSAALDARLRAAGVWPGDEETGLVLGAAGSSDRQAVAGLTTMARTWSRHGWYAVRTGYASTATPDAGTAVRGLREAGAPHVAVASYFLAPGMLADRLAESALAAGADLVTSPLATPCDVARPLVELVTRRHAEGVAAGAGQAPAPALSA